MNNHINKKSAFTLVEIMVTMAILVIMMSFLFQYVVGAQKIFTSSNRQAIMFDDAQVILGLIENDLQNMVVSNEPGHEIPLYFHNDSSNKRQILMMLTTHNSTDFNASKAETLVGYYLVIYVYNENTENLYRVVIDRNNALSDFGIASVDPWGFFGLYYEVVSSMSTTTGTDPRTVISNYVDTIVANLTPQHEVMDSIRTFKIIPLNGNTVFTSNNYAQLSPEAIKIEMSLYDAEKISARLNAITNTNEKDRLLDENSHHFSKVVFLNNMQ